MKKLQQFIILLAVLLFVAEGNNGAKAQTDDEPVCAAVSPTKMNVLYCGVPNPLEIAVFGYKPEDIQVSISQGTITNDEEAPGCYTALVNNPGITDITISCNGKILATKKFRVRRLPDPEARIAGGRSGAIILKAALVAQARVYAYLDDFEFDMKYKVTSFTISGTVDGELKSESSASAAFTSAQRDLMSRAPSGSKIYIFDIKAEGPDGIVRELQPLIYEVK